MLPINKLKLGKLTKIFDRKYINITKKTMPCKLHGHKTNNNTHNIILKLGYNHRYKGID